MSLVYVKRAARVEMASDLMLRAVVRAYVALWTSPLGRILSRIVHYLTRRKGAVSPAQNVSFLL